MKKLLIVASFFFKIISYGQTNPADKALLPTPRNQTSWGNQLIITDKNGQPFKRGYGEIQGSPISRWEGSTFEIYHQKNN